MEGMALGFAIQWDIERKSARVQLSANGIKLGERSRADRKRPELP